MSFNVSTPTNFSIFAFDFDKSFLAPSLIMSEFEDLKYSFQRFSFFKIQIQTTAERYYDQTRLHCKFKVHFITLSLTYDTLKYLSF